MLVPLGKRAREILCPSERSLSLLHALKIVLSISFSEDFPPSEGPQTLAVPLISAVPVADSFLWPLVSALSPWARPRGLDELVKGMVFPGALLLQVFPSQRSQGEENSLLVPAETEPWNYSGWKGP